MDDSERRHPQLQPMSRLPQGTFPNDSPNAEALDGRAIAYSQAAFLSVCPKIDFSQVKRVESDSSVCGKH